jgi:lysophospholipase L1-like esterase
MARARQSFLTKRARLPALVAASLATLMVAPAVAAPAKDSGEFWVATWGASPVAPLPANTTDPGFTNQTVRSVIHVSAGGTAVRIRLSNVFGSDSLVIGAAHVAMHDSAAGTVAGSDHAVTFSGSGSITIPPGALVVSDPVPMSIPAFADLAVSVYLPGPTGQATWHPAAHATTYVSSAGDFTANAQMPVDHTVTSWFYLTDVEVATPKRVPAIVTLGDSITDGTNSANDANHRWPNFLATRLAERHMNVAVVDQGIGGNRVLHDVAGPNALARFDRDVLAQTGVSYVTVLLGINDIGHSTGAQGVVVSADEIIAGHHQMIERAHEMGLKIIGCTLTPFEGASYFTPEGEAKRAAVNKFIRSGGAYDGVIDFDAAVRDPNHPTRFLTTFDSGDHLHPNDAGYQAMANAIDLSLFRGK